MLLAAVTGILLLVWGLKMVSEKKIVFKTTPFDLPVLGLSAAFALATLLASTNKWEALFMSGGTGTVLTLTVLYFLITNNLEKATVKKLVNALLLSATLLSLVAIYQFIGVGQAFVPANAGLDWLRAKTFSPTGGPLVLASFLTIMLVITLVRIYTDWKEKQSFSGGSLGLLVILAVSASGLGLTVYQLLTSTKPILLPQTAGWFVAIEAFKRFPLFGVGPENFLVAFTQGKPINLNLGDLWAIQFGVSSNYYFQLLTTVGILGLGAWLLLVFKVLKENKKLREDAQLAAPFLTLLAVFALLVFLPATLLSLFTGFILLGILGAGLVSSEFQKDSNLLPTAALLVMLLAVGFSFYGLGRVFAAEVYFRQSLEAAAKNNGTETYNLQIKAIQTNPYSDTYHVAYSQTNLALANSLASKKELTDQDKQNINQLISQSIEQAKAAAALDPGRSQNWDNLASIYRQLINVAKDADQWTIAAYNQAVSLDPANPLLRLSLGGIYYAQKNYDEAIRQFSITVNLKPDFANGHYNLASALREKGLLADAVAEMEQTQALVEPGSNDFQKVTTELTDLRAKLPKEEQTSEGKPETLTPPATPSSGFQAPITLPADAQPSTPSGK